MRERDDFFHRQTCLREVLNSKEKPFGWTVGEVGDFIHSEKYKEEKNRCKIDIFAFIAKWNIWLGSDKKSMPSVRAWSSREPATQTTHRYGQMSNSSMTDSGFKKMVKIMTFALNLTFIVTGMCSRTWVIRGQSFKNTWRRTRLRPCSAFMLRQVFFLIRGVGGVFFLQCPLHLFFADNAASMVKRWLIGLLEWAQKQEPHKV